MSLHMGVLIYGLAEGDLPGPSAAQHLSRQAGASFATSRVASSASRRSGKCAYPVRMIADSSMDEAL